MADGVFGVHGIHVLWHVEEALRTELELVIAQLQQMEGLIV